MTESRLLLKYFCEKQPHRVISKKTIRAVSLCSNIHFTKPLLERKRRARMNRCLDELKLLVGSLEAEGENINKLEKADILELTVRYIKRISRLHDPVQEAHRFQAGFSQCASEACKFLLSLPGLNSAVGHRLIEHLKQCLSKPRSPYPMLRPNQIPDRRQSASPTDSQSSDSQAPSRFIDSDDESVDREPNGNPMWRPW